MKKNALKSLLKFLIIGILIFGIYQSTKVVPVEEKRMEATAENFRSLGSFEANFNGALESAREGFYELSSNAYFERGERLKAEGDFVLETQMEGSPQEIEGKFKFRDPDIFILFEEEDPPIVLESFFAENFDRNIEEVRGRWLTHTLTEDSFLSEPVFDSQFVEAISEEEKINEKEMYHYRVPLTGLKILEEDLKIEVYAEKEDLNIYKLSANQEISFSRDLDFPDPFIGFSTGSSPTLNFTIEFSDIDTEKEIDFPDEL